MKIEVLYVDGCPNHDALVSRLTGLLAEAGVDEHVSLRCVASHEAAERERFLGSPTLRIDGYDVEPGAEQRTDFGIKCRLFASAEGLRGTPPDDWVLDALTLAGARRRLADGAKH